MSSKAVKQAKREPIDLDVPVGDALRAYYELRAAQRYFEQAPDQLSAEQQRWLAATVERQQRLEMLVLNTPQAAQVVVSDSLLQEAMDQLQRQYEDADGFLDDLARYGLSVSQLSDLLERQLRVDLVLERQAAAEEPAGEDEALRYYASHPDQFRKPERRQTWHLLITVNEEYAENTRPRVVARLEQIRLECAGDPKLFQQRVRRYSECPSALSAGELGWIPRGHLFPAIDEALFQLAAGEISPVVETEVGLHLVYCAAIEAAAPVPFTEVVTELCDTLTERKQQQAQRAWLRSLT